MVQGHGLTLTDAFIERMKDGSFGGLLSQFIGSVLPLEKGSTDLFGFLLYY